MSPPVVLVASGPSAQELDLIALEKAGVATFAVNGSIKLFEQQQCRPNYYMVDDMLFIRTQHEIAIKAVALVKEKSFFSARVAAFLEEKYPQAMSEAAYDIVQRFNTESDAARAKKKSRISAIVGAYFDQNIMLRKYNIFSGKSQNIGFSGDQHQGYFCARTIPYHAAQVAYWMGYRYLVFGGLDLSKKGEAKRFYDTEKDAMPTTLDDDFGKHILPSFETLSRFSKVHDVTLLNLSVQSRLPERVMTKKPFGEFLKDITA